MERTPRGDHKPPAEAGQPLETALGWDLTDAPFIAEVDEQEGLSRVKYDSVQVTPSVAVITVVANVTGIDPRELDPLYESIDSDALNSLCTADTSSVSQLTFQYSGCEITVRTDDVVEVVAT